MNETQPKRPRPTGRLGQMNKRQRLNRRHLGQWDTPPPTPRRFSESVAIPPWHFTP